MTQAGLWEDPDPPAGPIRRALDEDIAAALAAGTVLRQAHIAAVRRQANDLDRLEALLAATPRPKTWDYNPKTTAHLAFLDAVGRLFGGADDADDPFVAAVRELDRAATARHAEALDAEKPGPAD